jgi:hypothetical protein
MFLDQMWDSSLQIARDLVEADRAGAGQHRADQGAADRTSAAG